MVTEVEKHIPHGIAKQCSRDGCLTTNQPQHYWRLPLFCAPIRSSMSRLLPLAASPPPVQLPMPLSVPDYRPSRGSSMLDRQNGLKPFSGKLMLLPTSVRP